MQILSQYARPSVVGGTCAASDKQKPGHHRMITEAPNGCMLPGCIDIIGEPTRFVKPICWRDALEQLGTFSQNMQAML
jgi:hypothetical protein